MEGEGKKETRTNRCSRQKFQESCSDLAFQTVNRHLERASQSAAEEEETGQPEMKMNQMWKKRVTNIASRANR